MRRTYAPLFHVFIALIVFCSLGPLHMMAQQAGSISGTVTDASGGALPKAAVVLHRVPGTFSRQTTADAQGHFSFDGLPSGAYRVEGSAQGFANGTHNVTLTEGASSSVVLQLAVGDVSQQVSVTAADSASVAAELSPIQSPLDATSPRSEFSSDYIQQFTSPMSDWATIVQMAPGTFSNSPNGIGLGQAKVYFRGFADGNYDVTWDGIPFNDTNSPTHHSWAFFPEQWTGGIDFDRSPGTASTVGPTPFGGSINLLSREVPTDHAFRVTTSFGSFNTQLYDAQYDTGAIFGNEKAGASFDVQGLRSDGFQTYNYQQRIAGDFKFQYIFSDRLKVTAYSGWVMLDNNTPNTTAATRSQVQTLGYNFLLNNNPASPYYYGYNGYHLPTNFTYIGLVDELGHGWKLDFKPYNYSYKNHQWYYTGTGPIDAACATSFACTGDQLNGYHKFGEVGSVSQTSQYGVFNAGLWYEWASTNRYLFPTNPFTRAFASLPNYREYFVTDSYQPYAEYSYRAIPHLTLTGGFKYAYYTQDFDQYRDNGKTIGIPKNGAPFVYSHAGYGSSLPSVAGNYRIRSDWSAYAQFSQGSVIPPSSVFDVSTQAIKTLPKPARTTAYQVGTVVKLKRVMFDGDFYRIKFQNAYSSQTDPSSGETFYYLNPDSVTIGGELETNVSLTHGLSMYANGSIGQAQYTGAGVPSGLWVANTPKYTEGTGLTYQQRNLDLGVFQKAVGPMWQDNKSFHNQILVNPYSTTNLFLNYNLRNNTIFDGTKIGISFNNLFNSYDIVGVTAGNTAVPTVIGGVKSTYFATTTPGGSDQLSLTPGRSIILSITFGLQQKR